MNRPLIASWCIVAALAAGGTYLGLHKSLAAQPGPAGVEEGVQVLTRGPVHEAFAETVTFDPVAGIVVPKTPPAAIEELPPDQKPEGANVAWISGYWGWDDERSNFLWVSGIWRDLPPGRQWVPGYWGQSAQGFQWTSGYWADAKVTEVQYLSEPPATVEVGPNIAAPSPDNMWLPGNWVWQQNRYAWRPGFWASAQPDWDWVPAHYVYTPRGYVFVDGYWDYSVGHRGVLFAPVYFDASVYAQPGFSYSPATVIDLGVFVDNLFLRPQYQHYYFGDYYAANYQAAGFYPSYSYNSGRHGYDPIYAHQRWQHRQDGQWEHRIAADFQHRRDHEEARPPRTWAAQRALGDDGVRSRGRNAAMASPFSQFTKTPNSPLRFQPVDQSERQKLGQHGRDVQRFREERQKLETPTAAHSAAPHSKDFAPVRVPLPRSPFVASPVAVPGKGHAPPQTHEAPKLDPRVEAKPRVAQLPEQPRQRTVNRPPFDSKQPQAQPQPRPQTQPQAQLQAQPHPQLRPQPQAQPQQRPQVQPQPQPRPQAQPQPRPQVQPQPQLRPQPQAQLQAQPQPQPQPRPQPQAQPQPRPQAQPQPQLRPQPQAQPQPRPQAQPQPRPQVQPQPQPRPQAQPQPRPQVQPQSRPQAQPQPQPRPQAQSRPQPQQRPQAQPQPRPQPRPQAQPQPQPRPQDKPKDKDKK